MDATESVGSRFQVSSLSRTVTTVRKSCTKLLVYFVNNSSKGLYKKSLRIVVDLRDNYYLAAEELGCGLCGAAFQCWDQR